MLSYPDGQHIFYLLNVAVKWELFVLPVQEPDVIDSSEWFDQLLEALATPPLVTVLRVNTLKATVHDVQQQLQSVLDQVFCKGMF